MSCVFEFNPALGSLKDLISGTIPANTSCLIQNQEKGRCAYISSSADLDGYGVVSGVKTIVSVIKHTADTKLFQDDGSDKLEITGGAMSGTGMTQNYVNNADTDSVVNNAWQLIITEFSAGINFATDLEIDPTAFLFLQRVVMYDNILTTAEHESFYQEFRNAQTVQKNIINIGGLRHVGNFDGVDDYVDVGNATQSVKSISFWLNADDITAHTDYVIDFNGTDYITIVNGTVTVNGFGGASTTIYINNVAASAIAAINQWNHIVITSDTAFVTSDLDIGRLEGSGYLNGQLAEIQLFSDELNTVRIAQLYQAEPITDTLLAYYKLNEGSGIIIFDSSGNDNHGILTNTVGNDFWQQTRGILSSNDVSLNEDGTNWNADGVTKSAGDWVGENWRVDSGSFRIKEDATGKYLDCVTNGTIIFEGVDLSELIGNGYIRTLTGDLSGDASDTIANATNVTWANNKLTLTLTAGQVLRSIIITRGV